MARSSLSTTQPCTRRGTEQARPFGAGSACLSGEIQTVCARDCSAHREHCGFRLLLRRVSRFPLLFANRPITGDCFCKPLFSGRHAQPKRHDCFTANISVSGIVKADVMEHDKAAAGQHESGVSDVDIAVIFPFRRFAEPNEEGNSDQAKLRLVCTAQCPVAFSDFGRQ